MTKTHTVYVKNMVCQRCTMIVKDILESFQIEASVIPGKFFVLEELSCQMQHEVNTRLKEVGLEIIDSHIKRIIEDVKLAVLNYLSLGYETQRFRLSDFISSKLSYDFTYLSELFSRMEGTTIERYFILQRLERVKELIAYDQLSLSEIAFETGYSSVNHLSAQFKKIIGSTPSQFKSIASSNRISLDLVGA